MTDFVLLVSTLAAFAFGFWASKKADTFFERVERENSQEKEEENEDLSCR